MQDVLILFLIFIPVCIIAISYLLLALDFGPYWIRDLKQKWLRVKAEFYKRASDLFYQWSKKSRERYTYILFEHPLYVGKREGSHSCPEDQDDYPESQLGTRPTRIKQSNKK